MIPKNGNHHEASLRHQAEQTFQHHVIRARGEMFWEIGKPDGSGNFLTRLVFPGLARVVVIGDGPDIIFRSSYHAPEQAARWLAQTDLQTLSRKVLAGETMSWEADVALFDLNDWAKDEAADRASEGEPEKEPAWVEEARDVLLSESQHDFIAKVVEETEDCELGASWGECVHWDIVCARAAARRLVALLDAEKGAG